DLAVGKTGGDVTEQFALAFAERPFGGEGAGVDGPAAGGLDGAAVPAVEHFPRDGGGDVELGAVDILEGADQLGAGALFEEQAGGAGAKEVKEQVFVDLGAED